ncbi:MAG: hypothetical protein H6Q66_2416 [Firmicutes bacterium]|nr:hypothetical protein [Bacillota bacterium]
MPGLFFGPGIFFNVMVTFLQNSAAKRLVVLFIVLTIAGAYWVNIPLRIIVESDGQASLFLPTFQGDTFSLHFIHSVHKTPVWENFVVENEGQITLVSTEFESYGVGMPFLPEEGTFERKDNKILLTNLRREFARIPARVGSEARLSLLHNGEDYLLYQYFDYQALVIIHVQRDYFWFFPSHFSAAQ